jgi:glycosyltransferase involved in cell wall biosynthesis
MRIAMFCSPAHPIPPREGKILAPWVLAGQIADAMVDRGHTVDLYAAAGSKTKARLVSDDIDWRAFYRDGEDPRQIRFFDSWLASELYLRQRESAPYDIIHAHHPIHRIVPFTRFVDIPTVFTLHNAMADHYLFDTVRRTKNIHVTPISQSQQRTFPGLPYTEVVYNGIDLGDYQLSRDQWGYLLITGRIVPEKGFHTAIKIARQTGNKLIIAGEYLTGTGSAARYWEEQIKPNIDDEQILYAGTMGKSELVDLYRHAKALLFPIEWEEPFGLVMTEAMACGTPVVAFRRGSVPEVVVDGETGFVVDTIDEMVQAVAKIEQIDRQTCREHVVKHFSLDAMLDGYERVYSGITAATSR